MTDTHAPAPLVFIYDRCATQYQEELVERIARCQEYAREHRWEIAGSWTDFADDALSARRPQWYSMADQMARFAAGRPVVCLVPDWHRISHDAATRQDLCRAVRMAGGHCETLAGQTDTWAGTCARRTPPPPSSVA
ncbi:recombinase family protein [Streptomyces sp. B1866]|uniref:recombinase family protein n=1 Tax=Streptomyces sp. B1866 TaxID=3075431 RepID=UPI00288E4571|nr:recombinase family protein [Streptomyces sp. B1866]MDT3397366.1 recombinase family protein [Streptomyces sp. B1866]